MSWKEFKTPEGGTKKIYTLDFTLTLEDKAKMLRHDTIKVDDLFFKVPRHQLLNTHNPDGKYKLDLELIE
jgi:hypothetical protein